MNNLMIFFIKKKDQQLAGFQEVVSLSIFMSEDFDRE